MAKFGRKKSSKKRLVPIQHRIATFRRDRSLLYKLENTEADFFNVVEFGDASQVQKFLKETPKVDLNATNYQGLTALDIAVKAENISSISILLERKSLVIGDAVLHAVSTGNYEIIRLLLDTLRTQGQETSISDYTYSSEFPQKVNPLMLAAQQGSYHLIRLLIERGHCIKRPHIPSCLCKACKLAVKDQSHDLTVFRLNAYLAISNPAYISVTSNDPILTAFELDDELKLCAEMNEEYRDEYEKMALDVRKFAFDLLSNCRTLYEVNLVLQQTDGIENVGRLKYPRLQLAVDYKQKNFVAYSKVQRLVCQEWLDEWFTWPYLSIFEKGLQLVARIIFFPFLLFVLLCCANSTMAKKLRTPISKYLNEMTSHILFVFFVFMLINLDKTRQYRGPPKTGLEWVVIIWIIGFICHSIITLMSTGARRYFSIIWNWYDLLTQAVFLTTFIFWGKAYLDVRHNPNMEERKTWPSFDSTLIHEGLLAIASVLAFGRILYFLQQNATVGPYQISLERMSFDILSFLLVAFVIILSFATGMTRLYQYYNGMVQIDENKNKKAQLSSFVRFDYSVKTLFWALFGMSPVEAADVIISNLETGGKIIRHHLFTEGVGHFLYSLYHLIIGIALINVLIAILTTSYQDVVDNADTEWKFSRTRLWLRYINYPSTLPPPLSLIPLVDLIGNKISEHRKLPREQVQIIQCSLKTCEHLVRDEYNSVNHYDRKHYQILMACLIQRYFRRRATTENA